jgi:heme exporter protein D
LRKKGLPEMPDLGRYAVEVLSAYTGAIGLLLALVAASLWKGKKVRADLLEVETRRRKKS